MTLILEIHSGYRMLSTDITLDTFNVYFTLSLVCNTHSHSLASVNRESSSLFSISFYSKWTGYGWHTRISRNVCNVGPKYQSGGGWEWTTRHRYQHCHRIIIWNEWKSKYIFNLRLCSIYLNHLLRVGYTTYTHTHTPHISEMGRLG